MEGIERKTLKVSDFYNKLSERVSDYNAKLMLQSALISTGVDQNCSDLKNEEAKAICLELIKKGGPAFQVGKAMYHQVQ